MAIARRKEPSQIDNSVRKLTQRVTNIKKVMKDFVTHMDEPVVSKRRKIEVPDSAPSSPNIVEEKVNGIESHIKKPIPWKVSPP